MPFSVIPSTNVLITEGPKILLSRRINTGWMDGKLCLPGGHIEKGETPKQAAKRESHEELGVNISIKDLDFICVAARNVQPNAYVAYEFGLLDKGLEYINTEPERCSELVWVDIHNLPADVIPAFAEIINNCLIGNIKYLELAC